MRNKIILQNVFVLSSLAVLIGALGFGCGTGWQGVGTFDGSSFLGDLRDAGNNDDMVVISGKRTVSVINYDAVLDNMQAVTGVQTLSANTLASYNLKLGSFSDYGVVTSINAPMLHSMTSLASEVCRDLLTQEFALPQNQRRFFIGMESRSPASENFTPAKTSDLIRRFARSFWQRDELPDEAFLLATAAQEMLAMATDNGTTVTGGFNRGTFRTGIFLCTSMLSSTSAIEI